MAPRSKPRKQQMIESLRATICPACAQRPFGSETLGFTIARECEPNCQVFRNLDQLGKIATGNGATEKLAHFQHQIRRTICAHTCTYAQSNGQPCPEGANHYCPLSRFANEAVTVLVELTHAGKRPR